MRKTYPRFFFFFFFFSLVNRFPSFCLATTCMQNKMMTRLKFSIVDPEKGDGDRSIYFILYSETQCISKLDKIGIFIDMKFH